MQILSWIGFNFFSVFCGHMWKLSVAATYHFILFGLSNFLAIGLATFCVDFNGG